MMLSKYIKMKKEEWKDIPGYEGYYQVSNYGEVKALRRKISGMCKGTKYERTMIERILTPRKDERGYLKYHLCKNCKIKIFSAHRLVMYSFSYIDETLTVNHIDGNKLNNHVSNLEYLSNLDNINHYLKSKGKSVYKVLDTKTNITYESKNAAAKAYRDEVSPLSKSYKHYSEKLKNNNRFVVLNEITQY